jgi:cyclic pyranopterin phosphate synthase
MPDLNHLAPGGEARMVNVSGKPVTRRRAVAEAIVQIGADIENRIRMKGGLAKGNVLDTARLAGILGAKQTPTLIPMCHPIPLDAIEVETTLEHERIRIVARVLTEARTGVEMEAMTAAALAALTVYDMVKSAGPGVEIGPIRLLEKEGGKSGRWIRGAPP